MRQQFQRTFDQIHMSRNQTDRVREALRTCTQDRAAGGGPLPLRPKRRIYVVRTAVAAAVLAAFCVVGVGAFQLLLTPDQQAAFYERIFGWGNGSTLSQDIYDKSGELLWTLPGQERVPLDAGAAEETALYLTQEVYTLSGRGYTVTVEGCLYDPATQTGQLYYALENPNGIEGLQVGEGDSEVWSDASGINVMCTGSGHTYLDRARSTDTKWYIMAPIAVYNHPERLTLRLLYRNHTAHSGWDELDRADIPVGKAMPTVSGSLGEQSAQVSAVGLLLTGFAADPGEVGYVALEYRDGSRYVLVDQSTKQVNVSYRMSAGADVGLNQEEYRLVFNRLVDIEQVSAVVVNDTVLPVS